MHRSCAKSWSSSLTFAWFAVVFCSWMWISSQHQVRDTMETNSCKSRAEQNCIHNCSCGCCTNLCRAKLCWQLLSVDAALTARNFSVFAVAMEASLIVRLWTPTLVWSLIQWFLSHFMDGEIPYFPPCLWDNSGHPSSMWSFMFQQ